jgi:hypothetical protein|tara:strand:- start:279 stop:488 length:210 start_codon:yes stop_codon:yes gene_type:complete
MKSISEKIHQVFTAVLAASVIGGITMVMETHTRLALLENNVSSLEEKLQESNSMSLQILGEINRIHPRQ